MANPNDNLYEFDHFRLDLSEKMLTRDGATVPLTPKAFDTLALLVEKSGRLVEKDELMNHLWPDTSVEENSLSQNIYLVRKALGEESRGPRYIETVPRRGYRFAAAVRKFSGGDTKADAGSGATPAARHSLGRGLRSAGAADRQRANARGHRVRATNVVDARPCRHRGHRCGGTVHLRDRFIRSRRFRRASAGARDRHLHRARRRPSTGRAVVSRARPETEPRRYGRGPDAQRRRGATDVSVAG